MNTIQTIKVTAEYTDCPEKAKLWLAEMDKYSEIACDFEAAVKYSPEELAFLKSIKEDKNIAPLERRFADSVLQATPLDHPAHSKVTHLSIAWSDSRAYVFILASQEMTDLVMEFLVTTEITQIWHNACYDFKLLYYATGKFPKNYEDSQVFAKTIFNHVDVFKARTGLKELAGTVYGAWGVAIVDYFTLDNMYNEKLLHYAATDACATFWVYQKLVSSFQEEGVTYPKTSEDYSPWGQLPAGNPMTTRYPEAHFYHHTAKWLVKDTVKIMMNGLPIALDRVALLEERLTSVLNDVTSRLSDSAAVARFCRLRHEKNVEAYIKKQKSSMRTPHDYKTEFNSKKVPHRCFFMDEFAAKVGIDLPEEKLPLGCSKWSAKLVKTLSKKYPPLKALAAHEVSPSNPTAIAAMQRFAEATAKRYNEKYEEKIRLIDIPYPSYNPGSAQQTQELFGMLGITSDKVSKKTGAPSWDREQVEHLNRITVDEDVKEVTQCLIDFSFAAIVKNNFIQAFYRYTLEGELYGQYNLLGAKSGRYTSSKPNMLNTPSTKSIFAKPVKECFIAPEGFVVAATDFAALEDRVMGNLSNDENKKGVFTEGLDGHSLSAVYYYLDQIEGIVGKFDTNKEAAKLLKAVVDDEEHPRNKLAVAVRQAGKPISFGLAYGAYPPKVAASVKIPIAEAEALFDAYHNDLYPGVTRYREDYVLKTALEEGYIHLGLGFRMYSDNPHNDIRTLNNGTCQFWSILTTLAINKLHQLIEREGYANDIFVTSTIYDSIYFIVRDDIPTIKWLNDTLIPIMEKDFMEDQEVKNSADLEIGPDWAHLHRLPINASEKEVKEVRKKWD